jgi:transposase-like protein
MQIKCPKCQQEDSNMFDMFGHRREQVNVFCRVCGHDFVYEFKQVPKESLIKIIPKVNQWT